MSRQQLHAVRKPTVWIAQEPMRKDIAGKWVSKGLDLASAVMYGNPIIIWPPDTSILVRSVMETEALKVADKYDEEQDYVIALGSPTLIAVLAWAIGSQSKRLRMLEWDRALLRYHPTLGDTIDDIVA